MKFDFTDEQRQSQRSLRELFVREYSLRAAWAQETSIWNKLAGLGVLGVAVPENAGGLGGGPLDWILLAEEAGRAALAEPLAEAFVVPSLLSREQQARLAEGGLVVAVCESYAPAADLFILRRENELHAVPRAAVTLRRVQSVDGARRLHKVDWTPSAVTKITGDWSDLFIRMALATSAELIGVSQRMLELAVEYVKVRQQFGQPVGSFQAVKHLLADALLELELARPLVYYAAYAPSPSRISMAKAAASDAAHHVARAALQCHGAIGYSFEHDLHLWMKRGWALESAWGSAVWHREQVARAILDGESNEPSLSR